MEPKNINWICLRCNVHPVEVDQVGICASTSIHSRWKCTRIFILVNCELINLIMLFILSHDIVIILVVSIIMLIIYGE